MATTPAELIILGATVRTFDPTRPKATAVALRDGIILGVGDEAEMRPLIGPDTAVIDRPGLAVVPGLVDSHTHQIWAADLSVGVDLASVTSVDQLIETVAVHSAQLTADQWVRGWNLHYELFAGRIDGIAIADAVGGRPAFLMFYDLHTAVATPRALELAGVDGHTVFPDTSQVVVRHGRPTGELREPSAYKRVLAVAERDASGAAQRVVSVANELAALGLTGGHVMDGSRETLTLLADIEANMILPQRINVALWVEPGITDADIEEFVRLRDRRGRHWMSGMVKLFVDGVIETGTAWLHDVDCCGGGGASFWRDLDRLRDVMTTLAGHGFQCACHAIGDKAVSEVLDIYEALDLNGRLAGPPHRLEHLELATDDAVKRIARGGFVASMQPAYLEWLTSPGDNPWRDRVGDRADALAFRARDIVEAGGTVALGSDWPVSGADPRVGMAWARLGRPPKDRTSEVRFPAQTLTAEQALAGYTVNAARAAGNNRLGRVALGYLADLTVFAEDPVAVDADDLVDLPVELTIVGGHVVHDRAAATL
ncbi:hypothetical protein A5630_04350 [Mycolicibacterium mucogenicum]|uniref:Amidohydrolase 3 domain-containing protein n=1 Tax=Mycolicibacterium mucogenicum TaxID=56689 RepID=A0A1A3GNC0_MYCMU|nr:amidohydrolase [Mycolicibacterium mucogenicum]OBJ37532.1 hypothetical protein A5630_04350 [Mycolicibacterium mucogenicum]